MLLKIFCWSILSIVTLEVQCQQEVGAILSQIEEHRKREGIPGIMLSIVKEDSIIYSGGIGYANVELQESVTQDHLFRLGSISKSFTALGFLKLVNEGVLKLDVPIKEINNQINIENRWGDTNPITIENILEHTAGFDDVHMHAKYPAKGVEHVTCEEMIDAHMRSLYARWPPGVRMAYSNPGYILAGCLLEDITGLSYDAYVRQNMLEPLGMMQSGYFYNEDTTVSFATGYRKLGGRLSPIGFVPVLGGPSSDFCSNADEMSLFLRYMLSKGKKSPESLRFSEHLFDRVETPKTSLGARNGFTGGYGLGNMSISTHGQTFHGHDGGIDGFSSIYLYSREASLGLAISMNTEGDVWEVVDLILDYYVGSQFKSDYNAVAISEEDKEEFAGYYEFKSPRNQHFNFIRELMDGHTIAFDQNMLLVKDFGNNVRDSLYHRGDLRFYRENSELPFLQLINDDDKQVIWFNGEYAVKSNRLLRLCKNFGLLGILILSFLHIIIGFCWFIIGAIKKSRRLPWKYFTSWFSALTLLACIILFLVTAELYENPATLNVGSALVCAGSIVFFLSSFIGAWIGRSMPNRSFLFKCYYRLTSISLVMVAIWLLSNDLIAFRFWAY